MAALALVQTNVNVQVNGKVKPAVHRFARVTAINEASANHQMFANVQLNTLALTAFNVLIIHGLTEMIVTHARVVLMEFAIKQMASATANRIIGVVRCATNAVLSFMGRIVCQRLGFYKFCRLLSQLLNRILCPFQVTISNQIQAINVYLIIIKRPRLVLPMLSY
jgi:hypothetical protein